jgi:hypothetical protein
VPKNASTLAPKLVSRPLAVLSFRAYGCGLLIRRPYLGEGQIATFIEFWGVGATVAAAQPMTTADISAHLLADWMPWLPPSASTSFLGWPPFLIKVLTLNGNDYLALREEAGLTERQWKGVLSWMLGVAGTRQTLLNLERYRWIAPLSAFYAEAVQAVDLSKWHSSFPASSVKATRRPRSRSRLRPDYLALRPPAAGSQGQLYDWVVAESKGTNAYLGGSKACPAGWYKQARNVVITVDGSPVTIPRHLVIATRVNPNAKRPQTRRIQVRAWNSTDEARPVRLPGRVAVEIVAAHLFGLFGSLGLRETARATALSVQRRVETDHRIVPALGSVQSEALWHAADREITADQVLDEHSKNETPGLHELAGRTVTFETALGAIGVEIAPPILSLARKLWRSQDRDAAADILEHTEAQLDEWLHTRRATAHERKAISLPFGVEVQLPDDFEHRGDR